MKIVYVLWEGVSCRVVVVCRGGGGLVFRSLLFSVVVSSLLKRSCSLRNNLVEFVTVEVKLKLSMQFVCSCVC